jgi:hypothetical protein
MDAYNGSLAAGIFGAFLMSASACSTRSSRTLPPPLSAEAIQETIVADETFQYSAGDVLAGQPIRHVFRYQNRTRGPLRQSTDQEIQTSCGCTRVRLSHDYLEAGAVANLAIEIETDRRVGQLSESATVAWQDSQGQLRRCQFTISATVTSAFAFEPADLSFNKQDVRLGTLKTVHCRSNLPIDWQQVELESDASFVEIESRRFDDQQNELTFTVRCAPTHHGDSRRAAIHLSGVMTSQDGQPDADVYRALLPIYSADLAALKISPWSPTLMPAAGEQTWQGYLILTGDLIEEGIALRDVTCPGGLVTFDVMPLGKQALRVNLTVIGRLESLGRNQRQFLLTFANGLSQATTYRLAATTGSRESTVFSQP